MNTFVHTTEVVSRCYQILLKLLFLFLVLTIIIENVTGTLFVIMLNLFCANITKNNYASKLHNLSILSIAF